jgi:hypothetical protein
MLRTSALGTESSDITIIAGQADRVINIVSVSLSVSADTVVDLYSGNTLNDASRIDGGYLATNGGMLSNYAPYSVKCGVGESLKLHVAIAASCRVYIRYTIDKQ